MLFLLFAWFHHIVLKSLVCISRLLGPFKILGKKTATESNDRCTLARLFFSTFIADHFVHILFYSTVTQLKESLYLYQRLP